LTNTHHSTEDMKGSMLEPEDSAVSAGGSSLKVSPGNRPGRGLDVEYVRRHVAWIIDTHGVTQREITRLSGVSQRTLNNVMNGRARSVYRPTARKLLSIESIPSSKRYSSVISVDGIPTQRRVQALACLGYAPTHIATELGLSPNTVALSRPLVRVRLRVQELVRDFYNQRKRIPRESTVYHVARIRRDAMRAGYAPPWAWDHDTIDDVNALPSLEVIADLEDQTWRRAIARRYQLTLPT
jgi:transcriptional regulator with XRE-family HTH domain